MKAYRVSLQTVVMRLLIGGCASEMQGTQIANDLSPGQGGEGIPVRIPKRFVAQVYEKRDKGYEMVADPQYFTVPDPNRLYLLGFSSQPLSNATVELALNGDNTIQQVSLKSQSMFANALTATGTQINALAKAQQTREQTEKATATTSASLLVAADKADEAAQLASLQYHLLLSSPSASPEDLLKAKLKERSAKLDANEAARLAGKPPYYPEVLP